MERSPFARPIFGMRNIASILLTFVVLYLVYRELLGLDWYEAWASVRGASVGLFALAFAIFYSSYLVRAVRWEVLLANVGYDRKAGYPVPSTFGLTGIMYLAWFANCVTVARLGDAYRAYLLKREAGVSFAVTLGTVLAERILDLAVLATMMGAGVLVVSSFVPGDSSLPPEAIQALAAGLIVLVVAVISLLAMRRLQGIVERVLPERLHVHYARLEHGVVDSFRGRLTGGLPLLVALSAVGWVIEGATLYASAASAGASVSVTGALVVALAASLLSTVPFTPGGLGFTEAGMIFMLQWIGLDVSTATAVTLLFRLISYWSIVVFGSLLYVFGRNRNQVIKERVKPYG